METQEPKDSSPPTEQRILSEELISEGKWVKFEKTTYMDPTGKTRTWETVKLTTRKGKSADAVSVIPVLQRTLHHECIVLVKQFRPPMGGYCLEFPAGEGSTQVLGLRLEVVLCMSSVHVAVDK
ncbi:nudix (nucleoside diphosphate linked moiety X)-type motif 5, isoform CRA_b [Rattus norvegicus]|uniref:Nudix (Nucleoside diphosphate linked moiety X)-type motif 5, isoform CRA_b n=1 Tax=Rattus norvegicus TaxID=10116 RepID=A6JLY3_RAT|nr:nudix (nucleoside diphosphate linked moiety X)-type motif 5, isoform CRA_b [Rattus norvegicus]